MNDEKKVYACMGCGEHVDGELHTCPFQEDVCNDSTYKCNCCAHCQHECAMDI